jgi:hypothetical protein
MAFLFCCFFANLRPSDDPKFSDILAVIILPFPSPGAAAAADLVQLSRGLLLPCYLVVHV